MPTSIPFGEDHMHWHDVYQNLEYSCYHTETDDTLSQRSPRHGRHKTFHLSNCRRSSTLPANDGHICSFESQVFLFHTLTGHEIVVYDGMVKGLEMVPSVDARNGEGEKQGLSPPLTPLPATRPERTTSSHGFGLVIHSGHCVGLAVGNRKGAERGVLAVPSGLETASY